MNIEKDTFIKEYTSPGSPIAFASPGLIYYYYDGKVPLKSIENWLQGLIHFTQAAKTTKT